MEDIKPTEQKKWPAIIKKYFSLNKLLLLLILISATVLRFHKLIFQSLWIDEIETMLETDPKLTWDGLFAMLKAGDGVHPPLFFILEHFCFSLFGYNDWVARALSALAGIASVWVIFLLGNEIKDKKLGLTAAALMCINYFCIYYSQEARMYSLLLLFTTLSYLFFLRVCKYIKVVDAILFTIFTVLLIYTHYFGFLVVISEVIIAFIFLIQENKQRIRLLITLLIANLIILITYIPWLPHLKVSTSISKFWIEALKPDFFIYFFNIYFGSSLILTCIVALFLFVYLFKVLFNIKGFKNLKTNPLNLSFIFIAVSLIISLGIPYLRSVMVVPMLQCRYTIIVLPSILIAIAYGIEIIPKAIVRYCCLGVIILLSMYHLIFTNQYYKVKTKAQFRDAVVYATANNQNYTIINEKEPWQLQYYLKQNNFKGHLHGYVKENSADTTLLKVIPQHGLDSFYISDTFWVVSTGSSNLDEEKKYLESNYVLIKDSVFFKAQATLYATNFKTVAKLIDYTYFSPDLVIGFMDNTMPIWNGSIISKPIPLLKGKYNMMIESNGTPVSGVYPHNNLWVNGNKIGQFWSKNMFEYHTFPFECKKDTTIAIKIDMDNDAAAKDEDRNTFIRNIYIVKNLK